MGQIVATDGPFGNLVTNVDADEFFKLGYQRGEEVPIEIANQKLTIPFVKTFSDVPLQKPLLYIDSRGRFAFAVNQGHFSLTYGVTPGQEFFIPRSHRSK